MSGVRCSDGCLQRLQKMKFTKKTRELLAQLDEPSVSPALSKQVEKMDLHWWLHSTKPVDARQELEKAVGQSVSRRSSFSWCGSTESCMVGSLG